jgi:hypothetical protein
MPPKRNQPRGWSPTTSPPSTREDGLPVVKGPCACGCGETVTSMDARLSPEPGVYILRGCEERYNRVQHQRAQQLRSQQQQQQLPLAAAAALQLSPEQIEGEGLEAWRTLPLARKPRLDIAPRALEWPLSYAVEDGGAGGVDLVVESQTTALVLTNVSSHGVAYEIRTTNAARYAVRPATGMLAPLTAVDVFITLRAMSALPRAADELFDEFLVEASWLIDREEEDEEDGAGARRPRFRAVLPSQLLAPSSPPLPARDGDRDDGGGGDDDAEWHEVPALDDDDADRMAQWATTTTATTTPAPRHAAALPEGLADGGWAGGAAGDGGDDDDDDDDDGDGGDDDDDDDDDAGGDSPSRRRRRRRRKPPERHGGGGGGGGGGASPRSTLCACCWLLAAAAAAAAARPHAADVVLGI